MTTGGNPLPSIEPSLETAGAAALPDADAIGQLPADDAATTPDAEAEQDVAWQTYGELVVGTIDRLLSGDYNGVYATFDATMARSLPSDRLASSLNPVRESHGEFTEVVYHEDITNNLDRGLHAFRVVVDTESGEQLTFTITVNEREEIAGLLMR